jgi:hypothetical protein
MLQPRFKRGIVFLYVRQNTLFIAVNHPSAKMELNYNKDLLKDLLTMLANHDDKCKSLNVSKVVIFDSKHNSIIKEKKIEDTVPYYSEMAFGEFTIESEDKELREAFEKIRESIEKQI